jgi:hypothetical protein
LFYCRIKPFQKPRLPANHSALFPRSKLLNHISGLAEIILAIALCIPALSHYGAWGVIALLIAFQRICICILMKGAYGCKMGVALAHAVAILSILGTNILIPCNHF